MLQYRLCIPSKCNAVDKLFHSSKARLWKYYNVTMNRPNMTFFAKLTQCWCKVVIPKSILKQPSEVFCKKMCS